MSWDDYNDEFDNEIPEDISDGELFALESETRIPYNDYSKHLAAVESYEQGLAKRRHYEEYFAAQNADVTCQKAGFRNNPKDTGDAEPDPVLTAFQVYDSEGYDVDGFDSQGFDREGYNRAGFNRYTGFDRGGYDIHGNSRGGDLTRFPKL